MTSEFLRSVARALELEPRHIERCFTAESTARTVSIVLRTVGSPAVVLALLQGAADGRLSAARTAGLILDATEDFEHWTNRAAEIDADEQR
jgi:hypothetical protein